MEPSKRKAEVVDLTADHELGSRPPKKPKAERHCVIDLSPTVVDLASDAEAAAAPANPCLPHTSFPPSPQVVDSDDDAPAGRMALADGHYAAIGGKLPSQDQEMHGGGTAATQGCPGPEKSGNMITGKANLGLTSGAGVQDAGQQSAQAIAVAPAVSAFFGQFASASNPFQAAAVLLAATGKSPPQHLQALLNTAPQPPPPATLQPLPRPAAAGHPSSAAAALSQPLLRLKGASPRSASGMRAAEEAALRVAAQPEAAQSPRLQSTHASAAAATAEGGRSEDTALPAEAQLPHLRPVKVPPRMMPAQEEAPSDSALQAAAVSPSSAESSSGILLPPHEAPAQVRAAGTPESNTLDNPLSNMGKAAPGRAAADSPHSSATGGGPAEAAGAAVCSTFASPPSGAACGLVVGIVCDSNNSDIRPRRDARFGGIASITDRIPAALASGNLASADVDGPVSTPNVAPGCSPSAGITAAVAAAGAPIATAAPTHAGTPGAAASAQGLGHLDAPEQPLARADCHDAASQGATRACQAADGIARLDAESQAKLDANPGPLSHGIPCSRAASENAGMIGVPGLVRDAVGAPLKRVETGSGAANTAAAATRASAGPDSSAAVSDKNVTARADARIKPQSGPVSSATFTDSDVALRADAGTELQSKNRAEIGVAGGAAAGAEGSMAGAGSSATGAGSSAAVGLPRRIRSPPQRLEPMFRGKKHTMAAVGTSWTADDACQGSRRGRGRRGRSGAGLMGTIPHMLRCKKSGRGRGRPKGMPACKQQSQEDVAAPCTTQADEPQPRRLQRHSICDVHRGLQHSAAAEVSGQAAGAGTCPVIPKEESDGGDASSPQRPAATDVRKRRRRARMVLLEDSETCVPRVEGAGCLRQFSSSDDIWLALEDGNDESEEEVAPAEETCCRPSATTAPVATSTINGLGSMAPHAAAVGEHTTGTHGMAQRQRTAAEASAQAAADRAAQASPASVLIKEEPTAEACSQAAAQGSLCSASDIVERCGEAYLSKVKEVHARRQEHRAVVAAFDQALRCNSRSANLASTVATGCTPPETTEGVTDVDRAAAAATAAVVGAIRLKQACRPPGIKAEAMDVSREMDDGRVVTKPARVEVAKLEEPPAGMPDQASAEAPDQASADAPDQAPGGSRAAAAPPAGASKSASEPPRRRLVARKCTGGVQPVSAPVYPAAAPAAFALPEQLHVEVVPAGADESNDDELVHEIYSEEVHAMLRQAHFARSCRRNFKRGVELLPISHSTIPGRAAQRRAEEAVLKYFALTAEDKRAYMRSRVEVFEISEACVDHPAQSFNVATMRHLDDDRQVERGLRAVRDMPAFTLMGEYCGVVKTGDAAEAASVEDPMGFGGLKNDKLKDFCHSHPDRNVRPQGLWSEGMELVVDPCKAGNALRYINDYMGMPGGVTKNVATVEVFDHDTLRPHILFFTIEAVSAGEELLMDYGEQFRRFILSEGNRAKSLVAARKAAAEAQREVEVANAKTAEAMEEVVRARDVVQMAIQEAEDAYAEARLAKKEARKAKREKAELENLLKKHGIKH